MTTKPLVTIGVPVHNGANHLHKCLECLRTQTFANIKVIIFENHSTDDSLKISQSFVDSDDRFNIRPSEAFLNAADNFRRAILQCSGEGKYFLLRAHDDFTNPEYIQVLVDALEHDDQKNLAVGHVYYVENGAKRPARMNEWILAEGYYTSMWRFICSVTFPASWYYGLYRCQSSAADILLDSQDNFPSLWGFDRLAIMRFLTQDYVTFRPDAIFYAILGSASGSTYAAKTAMEKIRHRIVYARMLYRCEYSRRPKSFLHNLNYSALCFRAARRHTFYKTRDIVKELFIEIFSKPS